jgi:alpha-beta hydrolase superfamily lysophospholipase
MPSDPNEDTYVNAEATLKVIERNASHFQTIFYKGARHEIDNETAVISRKAISDIVDFLISSD